MFVRTNTVVGMRNDCVCARQQVGDDVDVLEKYDAETCTCVLHICLACLLGATTAFRYIIVSRMCVCVCCVRCSRSYRCPSFACTTCGGDMTTTNVDEGVLVLARCGRRERRTFAACSVLPGRTNGIRRNFNRRVTQRTERAHSVRGHT